MIDPAQQLATTTSESGGDSTENDTSLKTGAASQGAAMESEPARNLQAGQGPSEGKDVSRASGRPENGQSSRCIMETVDVIAMYINAMPTARVL